MRHVSQASSATASVRSFNLLSHATGSSSTTCRFAPKAIVRLEIELRTPQPPTRPTHKAPPARETTSVPT
jgi:hypothetical protein